MLTMAFSILRPSSVVRVPMTRQMINWNELIATESARLYRYFSARFGHHAACDLVQETWLRLVTKVDAGAFDPGKGSLMAYAFGLAHFIAREAYKKAKTCREQPDSDDAPWDNMADTGLDPEEALARRRALVNLRCAITTLSVTEQEILALLVDEELSLPEIATIIDSPLNTVKSHIHRAKARLRETLGASMETETARRNP